MTYNPNVPTGSIPLDIDYLNLQTNFQQLDTRFGRDHVPFSTNGINPLSGYHKSIHFNPVSTIVTNGPNNYTTATQYPVGVPVTTAGVGQLWSAQTNDAISTDTGLYWLTGSGKQIALTRNITPKVAQNGYTFLPGGLILQWGFETVAVNAWTTGTVTFSTANIAFPNACYVVTKMFSGVASASSGDMYITALSATAFSWAFTTSSNANYTGFYWQAIGY